MPTIEMTRGALVSGTWICTCKSMWNTKPSLLLATICVQLRVEVVRRRDGIGPVQRQNRRRHDLRLIAARIERVLAGAQRLLPDTAVPGSHERAELELDAGGVLCRQADIGLDDRDLALLHDQHRHQFDADEERIERVRAVE